MRRSAPNQFSLSLGMETLEQRRLLAGDVLAGLSNDGTLIVQGDNSANGIRISTVEDQIIDRLVVTGGTTSVDLNLKLLESVGLVLSGADIGTPAAGFLVGFPITPDSDFRVGGEGSTPLGGIEHTGKVRFNSDSLIIGDFTVGFDGSRAINGASGFYVLDNVTFGVPLFDIGSPQISVDASELKVSTTELLVSPELASVLGNADLAGVDVGDALVESTVAFVQQRQVHGGLTSVGLTPAALEAAELEITGTDGVETPADGPFLVGFPIADTTDFQFSLVDGELVPTSGRVTHTGTVTFNETITVGNFNIGFDPDRLNLDTGATGFFVQDTFSVNAILFDIANPAGVDLADPNLTIGPADLLVSTEFATFLGKPELANADAGDAQIDATVNLLSAPFVEVKGERRSFRSTTINGEQALRLPLSEITNIRLAAEGGSDSVRLDDVQIPGSLSVDLGGGFFDSLRTNGVVSNSAVIEGSGGLDQVYLSSSQWNTLTVNTHGGSDSVSLNRIDVNGSTSVDLGSSSDLLTINRSRLADATLDGGTGRFDALYARYSEFEDADILDFRWEWIRGRRATSGRWWSND